MSVSHQAALEVIAFLENLVPEEADGACISAAQGDAIARYIYEVSGQGTITVSADDVSRGFTRIGEHDGFSLFVELDERPGQFDSGYAQGEWHWKLRQARNNRENHFFDLLNGREPQ